MADTKPDPVAVRAPIARRPAVALASRPALAVATVVVLGALTYVVPGLERLRLFELPVAPAPSPLGVEAPVLDVGEARVEMETRSLAVEDSPRTEARGPIASRHEALPPLDVEKPPVPIEDATGRALDGFFAALERTIRKEPGAVTRIVHFGDSIVTSDYVTGTLRRKLQKQFGDSGHGFVLLANAWPAYNHNDVYRFASPGWLVSRVVGPLSPDGLYGLGGVSFRAPPGSRARFGTAKQGSYGRAVSRFTLAYLEHPEGGQSRVLIDGKEQATIDTRSDRVQVAYRSFEVPDGEHELELVTSKGYTRGFGVVMERDVPGVVLDAIGIQGARIRFLDQQDDAHWAEQLRWRAPNLVVYQFGANESGDGFAYPMTEYHRTMVQVLRQGREALPTAGCLVLAAMDRAEKRGGALVSMDVIAAIVKEQRRAASDAGCAFWNTHQAMGGPGSMAGWVGRGLGQADLTHPTGSGSDVLASWIFRALADAFNGYQARDG